MPLIAGASTGSGQRAWAPPSRPILLALPPAEEREVEKGLAIRPLPLWKRGMDIIGAGLGLLLLLPLMTLIAAAIRLTSRGPVIFRQQRAGLGGEPFAMLKFRTMVANAEARKAELAPLNQQDGPAFKLDHDPRVTALGRLLRCSSLDEIPQLWNVLRGQMSLVGPRPLPCKEAAACAGWYVRRLEVTPGITGLWQARGRSQVSFRRWMAMDLAYIRHRSLLLDVRILLETIPAVLLGRGAW
jgi:lipopolysaccharide/colanic/teichoic acid biosynthesis glycosyltransferase